MGDTVICLLPQCQHDSNNNESEMMFQLLFVKLFLYGPVCIMTDFTTKMNFMLML